MISGFKKNLRKKMREIQKSYLASLTYKEKHSLAENLCEKVTVLPEYKAADLIMAYIPDTLEADCTPVILDALEKGKKVCVPKVDFTAMKAGQSKMDFYFLDGSKPLEEQLETGTYGIREPKAGLEKFVREKDCRVKPGHDTAIFVLVPGVAFTKDGKRLGHGKGFYDIYIERMKKAGMNPFLCGICLQCQVLEDLPADEHDVLMDVILS